MPRGYNKDGTKIVPPSRKGSKLSIPHRKAISKAQNGRTKSQSAKDKFNKSVRKGEDSPNWKGVNVKYSALHIWVRKLLGTPKHCSYCESTSEKKYEWANKSHSYKRDLSDWIRLCTKCHIAYDKGKITI